MRLNVEFCGSSCGEMGDREMENGAVCAQRASRMAMGWVGAAGVEVVGIGMVGLGGVGLGVLVGVGGGWGSLGWFGVVGWRLVVAGLELWGWGC